MAVQLVSQRALSPQRPFRGPTVDVRCWHEADIHADPTERPLLTQADTARRARGQSATDPKSTNLVKRVPTHWGAARKFLNLYMREISYNALLREKYHLERIEHLLEVPLDSNVADALQKEKEGVQLPRWPRVIHLTRQTSAQYQSVAEAVAARMRTCRVHLDLLYWRPEQRSKKKGPRALPMGPRIARYSA